MSELLEAIYRGDKARADELLASDPELDVFEAAAVGKAERLRELLDGDPSLANAWARDGFQPLGLASFFGRTAAVRLLLERGAEVNSASRNEMQVMPWHSAAASSSNGISASHGARSTIIARTEASISGGRGEGAL